MPQGTAAYEKRGVATDVPHWDPSHCIQCNQCAFVCPHAAIRPFLVTPEEEANAPEGSNFLPAVGFKEHKYTLAISPMDCTGCGVCITVCPGKKANPRDPECKPTKALVPQTIQAAVEADMAKYKADIEANVELINGLDTALKNAEIGSLALIEAVGKNMSADYDNYNEVVAKYNQLHQYGQYADPTYEGAYEAYVFYSTIREAKEDIETNATRFIDAANILITEADFNTLASAFLVCKNNYYANTTYPGLAAALEIYNSHYDTINTQIEMAENFIKYVGQADYADYVPMKLENLAEAEKYMGCLTDDPYVGVTEAKALYDKVRAAVDEDVRNAELYIAAVNALDSLSGDALVAAIENALSLKAAGDVLGVDGVADANIKLDKLVSSIELAPKHRDYFLSLVASIDTAATPAELFEILRLAQSAEADAVAALAADPSYQSAVNEASAKLKAAIETFNAQVVTLNAEFAKANQLAANTCGIGKGTTPVADHVIALIKKFFEEE